jgi:aryl-alcohol dehydrogenase-like predicted oxidoreductase
MKTRELGWSGFVFSAIGLGCMGVSENYGPPADKAVMSVPVNRVILTVHQSVPVYPH